VSWQVTGIRHDAYAEKHRIPVEEWKPDHCRGRFMHPEELGQATNRAEDWEKLQDLLRPPDPPPAPEIH